MPVASRHRDLITAKRTHFKATKNPSGRSETLFWVVFSSRRLRNEPIVGNGQTCTFCIAYCIEVKYP